MKDEQVPLRRESPGPLSVGGESEAIAEAGRLFDLLSPGLEVIYDHRCS